MRREYRLSFVDERPKPKNGKRRGFVIVMQEGKRSISRWIKIERGERLVSNERNMGTLSFTLI